MGFSPEKTYLKIKEKLIEAGNKENVELDKFGIAAMEIIGTNNKIKVGKWIDAFVSFGYIDVKHKIVIFNK